MSIGTFAQRADRLHQHVQGYASAVEGGDRKQALAHLEAMPEIAKSLEEQAYHVEDQYTDCAYWDADLPMMRELGVSQW